MSGVAHVRAEVVSNRPVGVYRHLTLHAPAVAETARPGQFVACSVGADASGLLLRRAFSLHRADPGAGTVEVVVAAHGPGTTWITQRSARDTLDVVGPLGRGFTVPTEPVPCVVVGGGYGSAPLGWLAEALGARGCRVDAVVGAGDVSRLFGHLDLRRSCAGVHVTTDDGSLGTRGRVTDVLPGVMAEHGTAVVYACGPMAMLRAVAAVAARVDAVSQLAVEESMACGIGVCMTCVLPVVRADGVTTMARSCVEGPVFSGDTLRWDAIGAGGPDGDTGSAVPADCLGAPLSPSMTGARA